MTNFCSDLVLHRRVFQIAIFAGLGGTFLVGFQLSVISFTSPFVKKFINETWLERYNVPIDDQSLTVLWSVIVSIFSIGGVIGSGLSAYLSSKYRKKNCLIAGNLLILVAALITGTSKTANAFEMILLGRFLYGLSGGLTICIQGQYLGEISPKRFRGLTNATAAVLATLGKFLGQLTGLRELLGTESLWPLLLATTGIAGLLQLIALPFFPETPSYLLIQKGDLEGCLKVMKQLWGQGDHKAELDDMLKEQAAMKKVKIMNVLELFRDRTIRCQVYLMVVLGVTTSLNGVNAIYFYSFEVFHTAGVDQEIMPYAILGVGAWDLFSTIVCIFVIERLGRRKLLLWGYGLMALVLALLTASFSLQNHFFWLRYGNVALIFLFIVFFGTGPAGVTVPVVAEIFTQSSRPAAIIIVTILFWIGQYLVGIAFPHLIRYLDSFCFLVFMGFIAITWIILFRYLPETKGKSLMDIKKEFNRFNKRQGTVDNNSSEGLHNMHMLGGLEGSA
ncbi:solute carrier family 2, facilitated glucose transporter member 11-like [Eublepharis macularius]|uniref:Solute carrier family 2, facilitated glucose transporter member 5 n=1 Tax=Eublepharis macularius TaxID=481883 RepID=A0AA97JVE9_EUBMA|nr:solute carrier family 2, facilitated glucose transporter member 11-like [Eublepharis macularius]